MYMKKESSSINPVIAGLLLGIIISAMDNTIVSTAMGAIISDLGGMSRFIWVSSAYLIASVAGMPIYGKLSDMYGRKFFFICGTALFIVGSVMCGLARNMDQLIAFRAIQGLGGGAVTPIAFTIIFDIIPAEQRGKISGLFGAAYGVSSIFGPLIGSFLSEYVVWRSVFFVNAPLGLLSIFFLFRYYHESVNHTKQKIDWCGAVLLVLSVVSLMFALEMGGKNFAWSSIQIIGLFLLLAVFLAAFLFVESKAPEPVIPLDLFRKPLFAGSQITAFLYGTVFIIAIVYIPIFIQGVLGGTATNSGLLLLPMMLASVAGSQVGGLFVTRLSYRNIMFCSVALMMAGFILLGTMSAVISRGLMALFMIVTGLGVGISFSVLTMSSIDGIPFNRRGSANSSVTFFRAVGMTIGVAIFGTIQNNIMQAGFLKGIPAFASRGFKLDARALLQPQVRHRIPPEALKKMTGIMAGSITDIFLLTLIPLTIAIFFIIIMGRRKMVITGAAHNTSLKGSSPDVYENGGTRNFDGREQPSL